jgi:DNA-directed RNA polymerase specialized sigma24 family protein
MSAASVTQWIDQLKAGDQTAAQQLWERYFTRLLGLARDKLQKARRRVSDEEDVALDALNSFFRGVQESRFSQLHDRQGLWRLLAEITVHKALKVLRHEWAIKRGGGNVRGDSVFAPLADSGVAGFEQVLAQDPTPDEVVQFSERCERLLEMLEDATLKSIAVWSLEGWTNAEIAARLGCVETTVERKRNPIRMLWEKEYQA